MKKLTVKEEEIMNILWAEGPLFIREMLAFYPEPKPHYNTTEATLQYGSYAGEAIGRKRLCQLSGFREYLPL